MSFNALAWGVKQNTGNPTSKLVLLMLCNYADENNTCYPSQEHIANICHCSRRCVITHIQQLAKKGYIVVEKKSSGAKSWNRYKIQCENIAHNTNIKKFDLAKKKRNKNFLAG